MGAVGASHHPPHRPRQLRLERRPQLQLRRKTFLRDDSLKPRLQAASWIQLDVASKDLRSQSGMDLDGRLRPPPASAASRPSSYPSASRPTSPQTSAPSRPRTSSASSKAAGPRPEAVVYSAHYDHLGIDQTHPDRGKVRIRRQRHLQRRRRQRHRLRHAPRARPRLVRRRTNRPHPPAFDVFFASVTAEEQGLLGSEYLGQTPPRPRLATSRSTSTTT